MSVSPRTIMELLVTAAMAAFIAWLMITKSGVQASLADQKARTALERTHRVAAESSHSSCKFALKSVNDATEALGTATREAYAATDLALQRASTRAQTTSLDVSRLLAVRAAPGQDCKAAFDLAQAAWREGQ